MAVEVRLVLDFDWAILRNPMQRDFHGVVGKHQAEARIVRIAQRDVLSRQVQLF